MTTNTKILDRVRKLMRLAEGTHSADEAQSAMLLAQKLMAEHGIGVGDVAEKDTSNEVVHGDVYTTLYKDYFAKRLAYVISVNFRCIAYWNTEFVGWGGGEIRHKMKCSYTLRFIGLEADAEIAAMTFRTAYKAAKALATTFVKRHGGGKTASNSYLEGWVQGLWAKFEVQKEQDNSLALALAVPDAVTKEHASMKDRLKSDQKPKVRNFSADAAAAGFEDGKQFGSGITPGAATDEKKLLMAAC